MVSPAFHFRAFAKPALLLGLLVLAGCATPAPYAPRGPGQDGQLDGQGADSNKDAGQSELQGEGKTVHGEGSGPQGLVRRNRWSFRV